MRPDDLDYAALAADPETRRVLALLADPKRALIEIDREIVARNGLRGFIPLAWSAAGEKEGSFKANWHLDAISEHLEGVSTGQIRRLIVTIPPRHMKSLSVAVMWPAWDWLANPWRRFLFSSYAQSLSVRDSRRCRQIIKSPWYQARWGDIVQLAGDQRTKIRFENTMGGYRIASSVDGTATGEGGDVVAVDDPISAKNSNSETERENVTTWWSETMTSRLNDQTTGAFVLIQQRLHERDLIGYVIEREGIVEKGGLWTMLCLPAEYEPDHPFRWFRDPRKEKGELLWPSHIPRAELNAMVASMGIYAAAGQLQQRPAPREGGTFQRHWFRRVNSIAADTAWVRSWDLAATEAQIVKSDPDYTAGVRVGFSETRGKWIIAGGERFRVNPGELQQRIKACAEADTVEIGYHRIILPQDPGQAGKDQAHAFAKLLSGYTFEIRPVSGDKVVRAGPLASQAEMGNVEIYADPDSASQEKNKWIDVFIDELAGFPTAAHDDQVDAVSAGFNALSGGQQGLLDYFRQKIATRASSDAAAAAAKANNNLVAPDVPMVITLDETEDLARAYLGKTRKVDGR